MPPRHVGLSGLVKTFTLLATLAHQSLETTQPDVTKTMLRQHRGARATGIADDDMMIGRTLAPERLEGVPRCFFRKFRLSVGPVLRTTLLHRIKAEGRLRFVLKDPTHSVKCMILMLPCRQGLSCYLVKFHGKHARELLQELLRHGSVRL